MVHLELLHRLALLAALGVGHEVGFFEGVGSFGRWWTGGGCVALVLLLVVVVRGWGARWGCVGLVGLLARRLFLVLLVVCWRMSGLVGPGVVALEVVRWWGRGLVGVGVVWVLVLFAPWVLVGLLVGHVGGCRADVLYGMRVIDLRLGVSLGRIPGQAEILFVFGGCLVACREREVARMTKGCGSAGSRKVRPRCGRLCRTGYS